MSGNEMVRLDVDSLQAYYASDSKLTSIEYKLDQVLGTDIDEYCSILLSSPRVQDNFGTLGRTLEVRRGFWEMPEAMQSLEDTTKFIYMYDRCVDIRPRVTHVTRFLQPTPSDPMRVVGDILNDLAGQVDLNETADYHAVEDPGKCLYLTTDLSVPDVLPTRTKPYGLLAFRTMFEYARKEGYSHIFAYMNGKTLRNLGRLGISPEPLCGRSDYVIPPMAGVSFEAYQPFVLSARGETDSVFTDPDSAKKCGYWANVMANSDFPVVALEDSE